MSIHPFFRKLLTGLLALALVAGLAVPALAADTASTIRLAKTEGQVSVTDGSGKEVSLRENMRLYNGYSVTTDEDGYAWISLDDTKAAKLALDSSAEIRQNGKKLELLLQKGELSFDVSAPLKGDETLNIRTSTMVTGIRGTSGWARVIDNGHSLLGLLTGKTENLIWNALTGERRVVRLEAGYQMHAYSDLLQNVHVTTERLTLGDIPGFVQIEWAGDPAVLAQIAAESGLDLSKLTPESARDALKEEQRRVRSERDRIRALEEAQDHRISRKPVWDASGLVLGNSAKSIVYLTMPVTAEEVQAALRSDGVEQVILLRGKRDNLLDIDIPLHAPAGKTLSLQSGIDCQVRENASLTVDGTVQVQGSFRNAGRLTVNSSHTLQVYGPFVNAGTGIMHISAAGRVVARQGVVTYGAFTNAGAMVGSVHVAAGRFTMSGGALTNNAGTALTVESGASVELNGGTITATGGGPALSWPYGENVPHIGTDIRGDTANLFDPQLPHRGYITQRGADGYFHAVRAFTITWKNDDGTVIDSTVVGRGLVPTHADATKAATEEYTYTFAGWTPKLAAATGDAAYTATFTAVKRSYTVTWLNDDDSVIDTTTVEYGSVPTHKDPTKAATADGAYTFAGWTPKVVAVTGDATYKATFEAAGSSYTITWLNDDDSVIDTTTVAYGDTPTHDDAVKENTAEYTYTFSGWTPEVVAVTGDATYTAQFSAVKNSYTITWLNDDDSVIETTTVAYGDTPTHADAVKENTAEYTYTFSGWTPEIAAVTGDATYTAQFSAVKNSYTITWLNDDDSVIDTTTVAYGDTPTHADAVKENTAEYTYTFSGWTPEVVAVTGDATYTAQFSAVKNSYTITWLNDDDSVIETTTVAYGDTPTHADAVKENTAEYTYTFTGWTPEIAAVTGDATYTAQFSAAKNSYTITWLNDDDSVIETTTVAYGDTPTHDDAVKKNTAEYTYTFTGWTPEVVAVTGEATYTAQFSAVKNSYTITWLNDDDSVIDTTTVAYGETPTHDDAVKKNTDEYSYTFTGWTPEVVAVNGEATYTAQFSAAKNSYTITWLNDDDSVIDTTTVAYGDTPTHADAVKENTAEYTYTFSGWTPEVVAVTGDATYTAQFSAVKNSYTITWLNDDDSVIDTTTVAYGDTPTHADAVKENTAEYTYTFSGWTPEIAAVTGEATYTAQFSAVKSSYTITWLNDDGETIDTTTVEYGEMPKLAEPEKPNTASYSYTFSHWDPELATVTGDATYTAVFLETEREGLREIQYDTGIIVNDTAVATVAVYYNGELTTTAAPQDELTVQITPQEGYGFASTQCSLYDTKGSYLFDVELTEENGLASGTFSMPDTEARLDLSGVELVKVHNIQVTVNHPSGTFQSVQKATAGSWIELNTEPYLLTEPHPYAITGVRSSPELSELQDYNYAVPEVEIVPGFEMPDEDVSLTVTLTHLCQIKYLFRFEDDGADESSFYGWASIDDACLPEIVIADSPVFLARTGSTVDLYIQNWTEDWELSSLEINGAAQALPESSDGVYTIRRSITEDTRVAATFRQAVMIFPS